MELASHIPSSSYCQWLEEVLILKELDYVSSLSSFANDWKQILIHKELDSLSSLSSFFHWLDAGLNP